MARTVKVEFVGSAHDLEVAQQAAIASMVAFEGEAKATTLTFDAASQEADGLSKSLGEATQGFGLALPVVAGLATEITVALSPAIVFLAGELAALAAGALPLLALGGLAVVFTELEVQTGRWASSSKELDAANAKLSATEAAHTQALRSLKEAQDALVPGRQLSQVQLDHIQDLQRKVAETGQAVTAATTAQAAALKQADNPWLTLRTHLEAVGNEVAARVEPALRTLFDWLDRLVPKGQEFADRAADWFAKELPAALDELNGVFNRIGPIIEGIIGSLGTAFDNQLGHPKSFQDAVQTAFTQVQGAINQLLSWLARLSAWWETDGQKFAGDAQTDFQVLAGVVEALAGVFRVMAEEAHAAGDAINTAGTAAHNFQTSGVGQFLGGVLHLPGFAGGGTAAAGSWFTVGEAGPELAYAQPGGGVSIFPGSGGGAPGPTYQVSVVTNRPVDERRIVDYLREAQLLYGRR